MNPGKVTVSPVARVLVVDDSASARRKLALAVRALGHEAVELDSGERALELMRRESFDLLMLDIVMPVLDGLAVLRIMQADEQLRDVPVLVVSGLENEPGTVIEAIRCGALDFLPKAFEPVLLAARVSASLTRKRARDREREEMERVQRLTEVAALLERSLVSADHLHIDDLTRRDDPLGRFASVFSRLAISLHAHERTQRRRLAWRQGLVLLLVSGILFGLVTPLSTVAAKGSSHAMGLSLWVNTLTATICLPFIVWRRTWPVFDRATVQFLVLWGVVGAAGAEVLLFTAAQSVAAPTLSVVIALESLIVFALSAALGRENVTLKRVLGVVVGLGGVLVVLQSPSAASGDGAWALLLLALLVPACYAFEDLLLANAMPTSLDTLTAVGLASLVGALSLALPVWWLDQGVALDSLDRSTAIAVVGISVASLIGTALHARLTQSAGAVFGSQTGYVITLSGIAWAVVLLGDSLSAGLWAGLGLLMIGLLLVEPKRDPDDILPVGVFGVQRSG